jgi:hypothetical protein
MINKDLRNEYFTPTSELQDAYVELSNYLTLRSSEDLLGAATSKPAVPAPTTQESDNQSNRSLAMATILSPDGAFLTKDMPEILQQLNLQPSDVTGKVGDINVFGARESQYGESLYNSVGINKSNLIVDPNEVSALIDKENKEITDKITKIDTDIASVTTQLGALNAQNPKPSQQIAELERQQASLQAQRKQLDASKSSNESRKAGIQGLDEFIISPLINLSIDAANNIFPHVALYRHVSKYLDPASAASDYCNVFFNAIDSINMSMCVPYFRINIVDRFAKKKARNSKLSLSAFLRQTTDPTRDKIFYEAVPFTANAPTSVVKKLRSGKVISSETFFAPQTLLPDPTEVLSNPRRLDSSLPLLSLNSFSIGIESVGIALMSKKTADLSITLHDRSRLSDISPLVSVGNFSSLYFEIEWGWTHPHGEAKFDNPVARYLNALRYREIFAPTSYNMTMADGGAMNISLRLIGGGSLDAVNGSILNGGFITRSYASQMLNKLLKAELSAENGEEAAQEEVRALTTVLIDKSRTADMIDASFMQILWAYSQADNASPKTRSEVISELKQILEQTGYYKNDEIFDIIRKNIPSVESYPPAADNFKNLTSKYSSQIDVKDFTSIAGYLSLLVGLPLASMGLYSEVQIHTFKFNDAAGNMAGKQIADAPIRIADVIKNAEQQGSLAQNTSVSNALSLLGNYLSNPKQPLYGISSLSEYAEIKVDESKKPAKDPNDKKADKPETPPPDTFKKPPDFTTPNIRYIIRSVPAKEYIDEEKKTVADYVINPEKQVAQIIIYDANASPNFDKVIGAYSYDKLGGKDGVKITPDLAKDVFKRAFPSIVYGATNSMLKSVNVSTDINNAIAQQNIIDMGKDLFLGRSKSDASTDVSEISLFPGAVTVSMIGLPIIERGQEVYLDLGTGTTLDALYYVTSVKHDFRPGEFTTNLTLTYKGQGSVMSLTTMLEKFNDTLKPGEKAPQPATETKSAPTTDPSGSRRGVGRTAER